MTDRLTGLVHAFIGIINLFMVIACAVFIVEAFNHDMIPLFFFNAALFVANLYLAYLNFCEAKRLL